MRGAEEGESGGVEFAKKRKSRVRQWRHIPTWGRTACCIDRQKDDLQKRSRRRRRDGDRGNADGQTA